MAMAKFQRASAGRKLDKWSRIAHFQTASELTTV